MTTTHDLAKLAVDVQAIALAAKGAQVASKKKITTKDMIKLGTTGIVGTSLIKTQSNIISTL